MANYIAMLRGINVSGHKIIKMELLRASFAALGFKNVKTYIQSGNVVFEAPKDSDASVSAKIERKILRDFGFSVPVFIRSAKEMEAVCAGNPFLKAPGMDQTKFHVSFLSGDPLEGGHKELEPLAAKTEQFRIIGREVYLYLPNGSGNSKLSNTAIEKKLSVGATTRNWATVNTLLAMAR